MPGRVDSAALDALCEQSSWETPPLVSLVDIETDCASLHVRDCCDTDELERRLGGEEVFPPLDSEPQAAAIDATECVPAPKDIPWDEIEESELGRVP